MFVPCFDCIVIVYFDTLTEVFSVFFPQLLGKCQGTITRKRRDTARINYYNIIYHMIYRASSVSADQPLYFSSNVVG